MIRVNEITQHYGVRPVLRQVSLHVERGERVIILGPNGMGKTTLLAVMAGVLQPQKGEVEIDGLRRRSSPENELAIRRRVVYLPDHPWLPKNRTGREFLFSVGRLYDIEDGRLLDHIQRLLDLFELVHEGDWPIRSYSNGQQKKIAVCGALVTEAKVMLLDEPFSGGLDPSGILSLKQLLQRLPERQGTTVVMTTPVPELVEELADRIAVIYDGQVLAFDTAQGLRRQTQCTGSLAEVLERLTHPQTLRRIERYFEGDTMIRPLVGWFRIVLPPRWALGLFVLFLLVNEAVYFVIHFWLQVPQLDLDRLAVRDRGLLLACAAFGCFRVLAFHPLYRASYRGWLELTPWTSNKPLPVGPIHIAPQDICCFAAMLVLLHDPQLPLWRFPLVFLWCQLFLLSLTFFPLGQVWTGYAVNFGLGLVVRLWYNAPLATAVAAVVYCVAYAGLRRSLNRFPWSWVPVDDKWREAAALGNTSAQFNQTLGWPLDQLLPTIEPRISVIHGTAVSLLVGWWGYALVSLIDLPQGREIVAGMFMTIGYVVPGLRLILYIANYRSPISFWGRIWTLRWIIPGYDLVFFVPVLAVIAAHETRRVFETAGLAAEIRCPLAVVVALLLSFNLGPTFRTWRLTGRHRISPGRPNKQLFIRL